jgi:hypothetical protein
MGSPSPDSLDRKGTQLPRPTRSTLMCWLSLPAGNLVPEIWLPDPGIRAERERARFRLHLVHHRSALKCRIHASADDLRSHRSGHRPVRDIRPRAARRL